jgi:bifunctional polynucleotide phosphatase/kinase
MKRSNSDKGESKTVHPFFRPTKSSLSWKTYDGNHAAILIYQGSLLVCRPSSFEKTASSRIAAFDLDHTLVKPKTGANGKSRVHSKDSDDWEFLFRNVVKKVQETAEDKETMIVLFTNQAGLKKQDQIDMFKRKIENIIKQAKFEFDFVLLAATKKDKYRKPQIGMFDHFLEHLHSSRDSVCFSRSFYVGDAAGRPSNWKQNAPKGNYTYD